MARIYRDAYGVPHVRARSVLDLAHGQGLSTARDRSWQLEYQRRRATGTSAEVLGRPLVAWDVLARRTRMADTARRAFERLEPASAAFVTAYVDGLNAGLHSDAPELTRLGIDPEPWEPWTPLAVFHAQHLLFAALPAKLWRERARAAALGEDARLLSRDPAYLAGSNAWAVGGRRTASGFPLIGGDPHRVLESPGVYMQVRLACEDPDDSFDVMGFTFPGVPGVQHFGHAGEVAWAITNAAADYQDVYDESLDEVVDAHEETVAVRGHEPITIEVLATPRGPVFELDRATGRGLSLRNPSTVLGDLGFDTLLPLLRARSVEDVDSALDRWVEPGNNVVIADRAGRVRYRVAGGIPVRDRANRLGIVSSDDPDGGWTGWVDPLPSHDVPPDGHVVTANERRGAESDPIGTEFAPPHRAQRLHALLDGRDDLTAADFAAFHGDDLTPIIAALSAPLRELAPGPAGERVRQEILGWDGVMAADSSGAAAFAAWRTALTRRLVAEPALAALTDAFVHGPVFAPYLDLTTTVGLALETLVAAGSPFGIDVRRLATDALDDAAGHPATWGETHVLGPTHAFDLGDPDLVAPDLPVTPVSGDFDCVHCTGWLPAVTDECYRGSVARYVWDLGDPSSSGWVVPLGASGDPRSPHHLDQLRLWADVELAPVVLDWAELTEETS